MNPRLFAWFENRAYRKRQTRYRLQLGIIGAHVYNAKKLPGFLAQFWRQVHVSDLVGFTANQRLSVRLEAAHANLPELLTFITQFNQLMITEDDSALEQLCHNRFTDLKPRQLELYLADDKHYDVNAAQMLQQLQSQLLIHCDTLEHFNHQFYQRQASRFYLDLHRVTVQWVQVLTGQEIIPYNPLT